ncbi:MAG: hypothetical protein GY725_03230 [bacterium]|nr:hypothetical protein [bacterium]
MRIFDNFLYKVVALLVATLLWAAAQGVTDAELRLDLPVVLEDVPKNLVVVEQSVQEINLRLTGSRAALRRAEKAVKRYPISLAGVKQGESRMAVTTEGLPLPRETSLVLRSPSQIVFRTDKLAKKRVPIRVDLAGEPLEGMSIVEVEVEPETVVLAGARSSVRQLHEVLTDRLDVSRLRETTSLDSNLVFGVPNVWTEDADLAVVKVRIVIERAEPPASEGSNL